MTYVSQKHMSVADIGHDGHLAKAEGVLACPADSARTENVDCPEW